MNTEKKHVTKYNTKNPHNRNYPESVASSDTQVRQRSGRLFYQSKAPRGAITGNGRHRITRQGHSRNGL